MACAGGVTVAPAMGVMNSTGSLGVGVMVGVLVSVAVGVGPAVWVAVGLGLGVAEAVADGGTGVAVGGRVGAGLGVGGTARRRSGVPTPADSPAVISSPTLASTSCQPRSTASRRIWK